MTRKVFQVFKKSYQQYQYMFTKGNLQYHMVTCHDIDTIILHIFDTQEKLFIRKLLITRGIYCEYFFLLCVFFPNLAIRGKWVQT